MGLLSRLFGRKEVKSQTPKCTRCGSTEFYEGPEGGLAMNIKCVKCGHRFNYVPGIGIVEELGPSKMIVVKRRKEGSNEFEETPFPTIDAAIQYANEQNRKLRAEQNNVYIDRPFMAVDEDGVLCSDPLNP